MRRKNLIILSILFFALICRAEAGVWLFAEVDRHRVTVGERINYTLRLEYDPGTPDFSPPAPEEFEFAPFQIKDYVVTPLPDREGRKVLQYVFQLAIYELGKFDIPQAVISFQDSEGRTAYSKSEKIPIEVVPVPAKKGDRPGMVRPLKDLQEVKIPDWYYLVLALILIILILLVWLVIDFIRRKKKKEKEIERILPPHKVALTALEELEKENLPSRELWKAYYSRLSGILREYINSRFGIPAPESTTWELIHLMRKNNLPSEIIDLTGDVLSLADLVKFARHIPALTDCSEDMEQTRKIIKSTIPQEQEEGKRAGEGK